MLNILAVDFGVKTARNLERLEPNTFFPVPASVVVARRLGTTEIARPVVSYVERQQGKADGKDVRREFVSIDMNLPTLQTSTGLSLNSYSM